MFDLHKVIQKTLQKAKNKPEARRSSAAALPPVPVVAVDFVDEEVDLEGEHRSPPTMLTEAAETTDEATEGSRSSLL